MKRGYMDWIKDLLPEDVLKARCEALRAAMTAAGLDAVVVYGDVACADELMYLTNFGPYWVNATCVFTADGDSFFVVGLAPRVVPWINALTGCPTEKIYAAGPRVAVRLAQELKERFAGGGKIGYAGKYFPAVMENNLGEAGFTVSDFTGYFDSVLNKRDASYRNMQHKGALILKNALAEGLANVNLETASQKEVCAEIEYAARKTGALDIILLTSENGDDFALSSGERPAKGKWNLYILMQYLGEWLVYAQPFGSDTGELSSALDRAAGSLKPGRAALSYAALPEVEWLDVKLKTKILSDQSSSLNQNAEELLPDQIVSISARNKKAGLYAEKMYLITDGNAVALI